MSMPYPRGFEDRLDTIEKRLDQLFASIQNRGGITSASAGLVFPSRGTPAAPAGGGHLHAEGNDPYWTDSSGSTTNLIQPPPEDPLQTPVSGMPGLSTPNAWPGTYTPGTGEAVQDDLVMMRDKIHEIIDSLTR